MKREPEPSYDHSGPNWHFPLLIWKECEECGMEFVREWGWKFGIYRYRRILPRYLCRDCAPTREKAVELAKKTNDPKPGSLPDVSETPKPPTSANSNQN